MPFWPSFFDPMDQLVLNWFQVSRIILKEKLVKNRAEAMA